MSLGSSLRVVDPREMKRERGKGQEIVPLQRIVTGWEGIRGASCRMWKVVK